MRAGAAHEPALRWGLGAMARLAGWPWRKRLPVYPGCSTSPCQQVARVLQKFRGFTILGANSACTLFAADCVELDCVSSLQAHLLPTIWFDQSRPSRMSKLSYCRAISMLLLAVVLLLQAPAICAPGFMHTLGGPTAAPQPLHRAYAAFVLRGSCTVPALVSSSGSSVLVGTRSGEGPQRLLLVAVPAWMHAVSRRPPQ